MKYVVRKESGKDYWCLPCGVDPEWVWIVGVEGTPPDCWYVFERMRLSFVKS